MNIDFTGKRIIVAPLNWGLGHATRCIPIIKHLSQHNEVAIASDGYPLELLQMTFPTLPSYKLPAYNINYKYQSMIVNMMVQAPKFFKIYNQERKSIKSIIKDFNADIIISDNRFGVLGKETHNIFMTHQLNIPMANPVVGKMADMMHHLFINQYDECWVPDDEHNPLAGKMSHAKVNIPRKYIGVLSRLKKETVNQDIDILAVLSGPEPQRTKLEQLLIKHLDSTKNKVVIVRGVKDGEINHPNITTYNLLGGDELNNLINRAKVMVCRSGYSSLMDLRKLEKGALLIPTPGQYEQEYLAEQLNEKYGYKSMPQTDINQETLKSNIEWILNN